MPYSSKKGFRGTIAKRRYTTPTRTARSYGDANGGYRRQAMRRMMGPPAALYPRVPTTAMAVKSVDLGPQLQLFDATGATVALTVPKLGAAFFNRLSNRTRAISLQIHGMIEPTNTNTGIISQTYGRIMVVYDRQPNGALPSVSDILLDTNSSGAVGTDAFSMTNMNNRDRFMILRDRKVVLPAVDALGAGSGNVGGIVTDVSCDKQGLRYEEFIKLKGLESLYNSVNGGTIGDLSAGSFILLLVSNDAAALSGWQFQYNARFKFLD